MKKTQLIIVSTLLLNLIFAGYMSPVKYTSVRQLGMGGAGVAVVDTRDSILYNPAHVVDVSGRYTIPLLNSSWTEGTETASNIKKLNMQGESSTDIIDVYNTIIPTKLGGGAQTSGYFAFDLGEDNGNLGLGLYAQGKIAANVVNKLSPRFEAQGVLDVAFPTITYGRKFDLGESSYFPNLKVGATVKRITRTALYDVAKQSEHVELEVLNLLDEDNQSGLNTRSGTAYGLDLGMLSDLDTFIGPMKLGATLTNISTRFSGTQYENINSPDAKTSVPYAQSAPILGTVGLAMKASPFVAVPAIDIFFPDAIYAADFDYISMDTSFFKRLHLGLEQQYFDKLLAWRMGLNQGYPTMGIDLNLSIYHLGFTYYTEELGTEIGQNPQSYYVLDGGFYW